MPPLQHWERFFPIPTNPWRLWALLWFLRIEARCDLAFSATKAVLCYLSLLGTCSWTFYGCRTLQLRGEVIQHLELSFTLPALWPNQP